GGGVERRPHHEDRLVSGTVCVTAAGSPSPASAQHVRVAGDVGRGEGCEAVTGDEPAARGEAAIAAPCQPPSGAGRRISPAGARAGTRRPGPSRSEEHTSELQSRENLVCRLLLEKKKARIRPVTPLLPTRQCSDAQFTLGQ